MLIAMAGLPGTGKSTLAQHMAQEIGAVVLDKDSVRAALFPPGWIEYSTKQDDFCMSIIYQVSAYMLNKSPQQLVIIDGRTFSRSYQVAALKQVAAELKTPLKIIECVCSDETARRRLEQATSDQDRHPAANRNYALYLEIKAHFEPINEAKLVVNTDEDLARSLARCLLYVRNRSGTGQA